IDGVWTEFCQYDLRPASEEERDQGYQRHHIPGETWVVGSITLMRYFDATGEVFALRDGRFTHYREAGKLSLDVTAAADYERHLREDLVWPELPIADALQALE